MKKRLYLGLLAVAALAVLTTVGSLALFSANTDIVDATYTAGTVTLERSAVRTTDVTGIAPGDGDSETFRVTYRGTLRAWLGLYVWVDGGLMTCDGGGRFTVGVSDGTTDHAPAANITDPPVVLGTAPVATNAYKDLTLHWGLSLAAGNGCQGQSAHVIVTVKAVQSSNNTNGAGNGPISWQ